MKKYVLLNNQAYTLLESIMGILILAIISLLLLSIVNMMNKNNINNYFLRHIASLEQSMEKDFMSSKKAIVENNKLTLELYENIKLGKTKKSMKINYQCKNKKLLRQKNGVGGESVMQNLDKCLITDEDGAIFITLQTNKKKEKMYVGQIKR